MDHHTIRQSIRQQRGALSAAQQHLAASALSTQLSELLSQQPLRRLAIYLANDGEIDPVAFARSAQADGIQLYLPLVNGPASEMKFAPFSAGAELKSNRFGIPEPVVSDEQLIYAAQLDVVLMPLVAFDAKANRIGMGGGYYDRTLAFKRKQSYYQPPELIGLAHSFQQLQAIQPSSWDVPMDGIATEQRAWRF